MAFKREAEMARRVVAWFNDNGWEVYQEVQVFQYSNIADIVAVSREDMNRPAGLVWIVECKRSFGLTVVDQAMDWIGFAHRVSVAVPRSPKSSYHGGSARLLLETVGIGVIAVGYSSVTQHETPRLNRRPGLISRLQKVLRPEHKTFAEAGNAFGMRLTPYQMTCDRVRRFVRAKPGTTMKELVEGIEHHYSGDISAKTSLAQWIRQGSIKGVRVEKKGRLNTLYPVEITEQKA